MKHNFECDQCSKMYSSRQSRWRHKRNDHIIPAKLHKQQFNLKSIKRKNGGGTTSGKSLQKFLPNLKILQSPDKESLEEEKQDDNRTNSNKELKKLLQKMLQSLNEESGVQEEMEKKIEHQQDIEDIIFEDVTVEERKRFYRLLNELKSRKSRLDNEDFQKIDMLLPQYFKKEYGMQADGWRRQEESFSEQIDKELRRFQQALPLISLEMQMILTFMDKKRILIQDLLRVLERDDTAGLQKMNFRGELTDDEYKELKEDLNSDTIARVLSNSIFESLDSENIKYE